MLDPPCATTRFLTRLRTHGRDGNSESQVGGVSARCSLRIGEWAVATLDATREASLVELDRPMGVGSRSGPGSPAGARLVRDAQVRVRRCGSEVVTRIA
jgi:hypothetical protein